MWVVLVKKTKMKKELKSHRHYFDKKSEAENFAEKQNKNVEIFELQMMNKANA